MGNALEIIEPSEIGQKLAAEAVFLEVDGKMVAATPYDYPGTKFRGLMSWQDGRAIHFVMPTGEATAVDITAEVLLDRQRRLVVATKRGRQVQVQTRRRLKHADQAEPSLYQEVSAPTEAVVIKLGIIQGQKETRVQSRRRIVDARLWASLDSDLQDAMLAIDAGYRALIGGLGMKPASVERKSAGRVDQSNRDAIASADYCQWINEVDGTIKLDYSVDFTDERYGRPMTFGRGKAAKRWTLERLCPEAATAIICHGKSLQDVDALYGRQKGWAAENLRQALIVWCWRTNTRRRPPPPKEEESGYLTYRQLLTRQRNRRVDRIEGVLTERARVIKPHG
jgi:hypothetical protein